MTYGRSRGSGSPKTNSQRSCSSSWRTTRSFGGAATAAMLVVRLPGRLVEAERRALVVLAEHQAAEALGRVGIVGLLPVAVAAELAHAGDGGAEVVDTEEHVRAGAGVA